METMILQKKEIDKLSKDTIYRLLNVLYIIEDETDYQTKKISNTIDYLQSLI